MWPRLGKITALVSFLATLIAFVYQLQQYRQECPELPWLTCLKKVLLPDPAKEPLPSAAKNEWERAVRDTESEDRIEDFINKYKEGPSVKLAQERLKISRVWRSIKTTDPRSLFEFLSNYHDPVFAKLAKDALKTLDDQAWQLAVSVSSREAVTRYVNEWSALGGRHLQDAQAKLNDLDDDDAWRVASREDSPEAYRQYLNHPWTRHAGQARKRLDEFAAAKWEREVKNTDSEEVLEEFIDRYKEGPYVALAQERLQVAQAWRRIKNTNDPQALSAFLSKYHDPIFEQLAKDALKTLDDQAWQLAVSAGTREAFEAYAKIWSALRPPGRHIEDAKNRLREPERAYWDLDESDPEAGCTATSTMYSITEGTAVKFYYENPSECMRHLPVKKDTLKFEGTKNGRSYQGKSYVFTAYCRGQRFGYAMSGGENDNHTLITLRGPAPLININTCRIDDYIKDSNNSTLKFKAREIGERETTAKIKPSDKPDQIRR